MKIAIMQPYFMPYIGYFQLINAVDRFVILDDVNYINKGWINRNRILLHGLEKLFTIPIKAASQNKLICQVELVDDLNWKMKFLKTLNYNYKRAPYYKEAYPVIENIVLCPEKRISNFNHHNIRVINQYLGIGTTVIPSSSIYQNNNLKGQERILDICRKEKATVYINTSNGIHLYLKEAFTQNRVELYFIKSYEIQYSQFNNKFVPGLSIIDVMMFNPVPVIREYLKQYELN